MIVKREAELAGLLAIGCHVEEELAVIRALLRLILSQGGPPPAAPLH
jgi:hypothetical protein